MKKLLTLLIVTLMVLALGACSQAAPDATPSGDPTVTDNTEPVSRELHLGQVIGAAHGDKCFSIATAVVEGETIVAAYIDEFQYMDASAVTGVPNSENFTDYVTEGYVLGSKRVNSEYYSANMAAAGSTVAIADNYNAIQAYVTGKTVSELSELSSKTKEEVVELISGATLADSQGYVNLIVQAAKGE